MTRLEHTISPPGRVVWILTGMALRSVLVLLLFASPVHAQSLVTGMVTDPQSAVIPDARVALLSGQAELRTTRTDNQGRYRFDAVQPGTYVVSVSSPGFQQTTSPDIVVTAGQNTTRDLSLALAGATDFVAVEGVARAGYRADAVTSLGLLGAEPLVDTPYTVNVLPSELIANGQVKNFKEASKYLPLVEFQEMQGSEILRPATRGMQAPVRRVSVSYDNDSSATGQVDFGGRAGTERMFGIA